MTVHFSILHSFAQVEIIIYHIEGIINLVSDVGMAHNIT